MGVHANSQNIYPYDRPTIFCTKNTQKKNNTAFINLMAKNVTNKLSNGYEKAVAIISGTYA
jgi:hypothetical protein